MRPGTETADQIRPSTNAGRRAWLALAVLCLAQFMLILDISAVNVALPGIGHDLGLGRVALTWVVSAYTLTFGGFMVLGGRLADSIGAHRMLRVGLVVFVGASAATGLARSGGMLVAGRIAQGIGAAMLSPAALSTVITLFRGSQRNRALGVWSALAGMGTAIGVLLGGALTDGPGWRWIFYINLPVGIFALVTLPRAGSTSPARNRVDATGALLVTLATGSLIYGLIEAGDRGWGLDPGLALLIGAAVLYAIFVFVERRTANPLFAVGMLRQRPVVVGAYLMLVSTALLIGFFFLGSLQLQGVYAFTALSTGLLFLPVAVATALGAHLASRHVTTHGRRPVAVIGLLVLTGACTVLTCQRAPAILVAGMAVAALGAGMLFVAANAIALADVPAATAGRTSALISTCHELGAAIGSAGLSTIAAAGINHHTETGFGRAFAVCAVIAAVAASAAFFLVPVGRGPVPVGMPGH
jgi:EmrB/QacA subfamily drug resistance transporter